MIELNHVKKSFQDIVAVDDVSVSIQENQLFGLIGTNGAGKSTILRMIAGVYRADQGEVCIDGERYMTMLSQRKSYSLFRMNLIFLKMQQR